MPLGTPGVTWGAEEAWKMVSHKKFICAMVAVWIAAGLAVGLAVKQSSLEWRIMSAIRAACTGEGECTIDMREIADFSWDTVSIFAAGNSPQVMEALGVYPDISDGLVFSQNGEPVKVITSVYDFIHNEPPNISFYLLEEPYKTGRYYKSYAYEDAVLYGKRYRQPNGLYKYMVLG